MEKKKSYNTAAIEYDTGRPEYPVEVIDWIINKSEMNCNSDYLLEIAPGTGQATLEFGRRGFDITCVELSENLANILKTKVKDMNVQVDVSAFEDWVNPEVRFFDFIFCATAFHWLDPDIRFKKCSELLTDSGSLILIWNVFSSPNNKLIEKAYSLLWEHYPNKAHPDPELLKENRKDAINASSEFYVTDYLDFKWSMSQTKEQEISGFYSQSSYLSLDESTKKTLKHKLDSLFLNLPKEVMSELSTTVYICKRSTKSW